MTDAALNYFVARGTAAERAAFTPNPQTPASGPDPLHIWYETDTGDTYAWDGSAWDQVNTGGSGITALDDIPDVDTTGVSDGDVLTYDNASGDWIAAAPTGGGGGGSAPALRSSRITAYTSASSFSFTLPTGAAAGDLCVIIYGGGFGPANITSPSSAAWETKPYSASNWAGTIFSRILTATDIAAGTITVTPSGAFNAVIIGVCFNGPGQIRLPLFAFAPGAGASSSAVETDGSGFPLTTDYVIAFATNRGASNNTSTFGSALQTVNATNGSGAVYGGNPASAGGVSSTFAYSTAGTGRFEGFVVVTALS